MADLLLLGWAVPLIAFSTPTTHHHTMLRQETSLFVNDLPCSPDSLLADHQSSNLVNTISDLAVPSITYATVAGDQSTLWISIGTGTIDWSSPFEAVFGGITLLYFAVSIWAGIKYIVKDGWRPKLWFFNDGKPSGDFRSRTRDRVLSASQLTWLDKGSVSVRAMYWLYPSCFLRQSNWIPMTSNFEASHCVNGANRSVCILQYPRRFKSAFVAPLC